MDGEGFKDHFSAAAGQYRACRPGHPAGLFRYLASLAPGWGRAWDCGAGSGQASVGLASYFEEVVAVDASPQQIAQAEPHPKVRYVVAPVEAAGLPSESVDLTVAAQAVHWFDFDRFYAEVWRVSRPGAILAVWCYWQVTVGPEVDPVWRRFVFDTVGPYWPAERRYVESGYETIPFPFQEIPAPDFTLEAHWRPDELAGYMATWSSVARCRAETGKDPVPAFQAELEEVWGDPAERRRVTWPIHMRLGKVRHD